MREAILREIERGGQVFFVHNRVQTIQHAGAAAAASWCPRRAIGVGHGQMAEDQLGAGDARVRRAARSTCWSRTTIIEIGLDIPNVNTIIINHADTFGLAQLYQLRGRVGRGDAAAYAYFLYHQGAQR